MGSPHQTVTPSCTRLLSPLPSWLSPSPTRSPWPTPPPRLTPRPLPITSPLPTRRRSSPLSLSPMSTESLMTTARPTSRRSESQDGNGVVSGSFTIALPDGRIQTTTYTADHYNGFVADVTYEGTPVYPPEPKEGYGHAAPAYAPAPAPAYKPAA